jgi:FMN reductase [NAD(P)H]
MRSSVSCRRITAAAAISPTQSRRKPSKPLSNPRAVLRHPPTATKYRWWWSETRNSRARIAEIAGGQPWIAQAPVFIAVIADFYKTGLGVKKAGGVQVFQRSLEGILAAVSDAGIAMATLMTAARSFGLGVVPIGGIRRDPQAMIDLLQLPPNTFPVDGVVLGYVAEESSQKPRMAIESFRHEETYHPEVLEPAIDAYDRTLQDYWQKIGRADGLSWSANMAQHYSTFSRLIKSVAQKQGFTIEV